jgi:hypothetical protein
MVVFHPVPFLLTYICSTRKIFQEIFQGHYTGPFSRVNPEFIPVLEYLEQDPTNKFLLRDVKKDRRERELKGDATMASPSGKKPAYTGSEKGESRTAEYRSGTVYPDEYVWELTPLDIIKLDTDMLDDDIRHVFELPPNTLDVVDYLSHYFLPAEKAA